MTCDPTRRQATAALFALPLLGACATGARPLFWQDGIPLPFATQEIYPAVHSGRIHVAGGLVGSGGRLTGVADRHVSWAPGEAAWREEGMLPGPRHHPNLCAVGSELYAVGGFVPNAAGAFWVNTDDLMRYDGAARAWVPGTGMGTPLSETVTAALGGALHVVGGRAPIGDANATWRDHRDTDRHLVYVPSADRWEAAAPPPTKRNSGAGAVLAGDLHVVGGRQVGGGNLANHEVYDPKEDRWRDAAPMPQGQGGLAAAALGGKLYAFGGEFFEGGGGVYPDTWIYDPKADAWTDGPPMPTPRHGLGGVRFNGAIYAIGGATAAGGNGTAATVERLVAP